MNRRPSARRLTRVAAALLAVFLCSVPSAATPQLEQASRLLDISGLAWIEDGLFVAVHDAKNKPDENDRPRVSLLFLPADVGGEGPLEAAREASAGIYYRNLEVAWPGTKPNDFESIARIPGTRQMLLVESGDDNSSFQRLFLASLDPSRQLTIDEVVPWPVPVFNVEASAVFRLGADLYFAYAERADSQARTEIRWAKMELNPLRFGPFSSARYAAPEKGPGFRPVVALEIDPDGEVYAVAAHDPDDDNGPFYSYVSRIGQFRVGSRGGARFVPAGKGGVLARQDGFKIEGLALRIGPDGSRLLYAGTDDENFGAALRQVILKAPRAEK
jgi:hypothetical protein